MKNIKTLKYLITFLFLSVFTLPAFSQKINVSKNKNVQLFIQKMVKEHGFDKKNLTTLFNQVEIRQDIINQMKRPYEDQPWYVYKKQFVTQERAQAGVKYWEKHADALKKAEKKYGIPAEIIVAIVGVETYYGVNTKHYRVIDALSTLSFSYPPREKFFRSELEQFLLLTRDQKLNPLVLEGSYAGAMGYPQFMPSSYRLYAIDFTGNGKIDIWNDTDDVIGSIANYLKMYRWESNQPVVLQATVNGKKYKKLLQEHINLAVLEKDGVKPNKSIPKNQIVRLFEFQKDKKTDEYWLTFHNFDVIMQYNTSPKYAMAIYQLGQYILTLQKTHNNSRLNS